MVLSFLAGEKGDLSSTELVLIEYIGHHIANILQTVYYCTEQDDRAKYSNICTYTDVHDNTHIGSIQKFIVNPSVIQRTI